MKADKTSGAQAVALLALADPVGGGLDDPDLDAARKRLAARISSDGQGEPPCEAPPTARVVRRRWARITVAAAAAGIGAIVIALTAGSGSRVSSADALTIDGAIRALTGHQGQIFHVDFTGLVPHHPAATISLDSWDQLGGERMELGVLRAGPGGIPGSEEVQSLGAGRYKLGTEAYDPRSNTITITAAQHFTPAELKRLDASNQRPMAPLWSGYLTAIRRELLSGRARVAGRAQVDGRSTFKIVFEGSPEVDYVAADGSYVPVEIVRLQPSNTTVVFHTFEYLAMAGHRNWFSLRARHPTARIRRVPAPVPSIPGWPLPPPKRVTHHPAAG